MPDGDGQVHDALPRFEVTWLSGEQAPGIYRLNRSEGGKRLKTGFRPTSTAQTGMT